MNSRLASSVCAGLLYVVFAVFFGACGNAQTGTGTTSLSSNTTKAPLAPTGVKALAGDGQVVISWTASSDAVSYNVYYATSPAVSITSGTKVAKSSGSAITGLIDGTTYYFVVTSVNSVGESALSSEVSATPQVSSPSAPTGLLLSPGNGQITISWTAVTGATSYNVYYRTSSGVNVGNSIQLVGVTSSTTITGLNNGSTYYFVVTALNAGGESSLSSESSSTPSAPPSAPTGVSVTAGSGQAILSWSAVSGATIHSVLNNCA